MEVDGDGNHLAGAGNLGFGGWELDVRAAGLCLEKVRKMSNWDHWVRVMGWGTRMGVVEELRAEGCWLEEQPWLVQSASRNCGYPAAASLVPEPPASYVLILLERLERALQSAMRNHLYQQHLDVYHTPMHEPEKQGAQLFPVGRVMWGDLTIEYVEAPIWLKVPEDRSVSGLACCLSSGVSSSALLLLRSTSRSFRIVPGAADRCCFMKGWLVRGV